MDNAIIAMRDNIKEKQKLIDELNAENMVMAQIITKMRAKTKLDKAEIKFIDSIFDKYAED